MRNCASMSLMLAAVAASFLVGRAAHAQNVSKECKVAITGPTRGAKTGTPLTVEGTASLPEAAMQFVWVLVNPDGTQSWWMQGNGPARVRDGKWRVQAYIGEPGKGHGDYYVLAIVLDAATNQLLLPKARANQKIDDMPGVVNGCPIVEVKVTKNAS